MNELVMKLLIVYSPIVLGLIFLWLVASWILRGRYIRHLQEVIANRDTSIRALKYEREVLREQQRRMVVPHRN